MKDRWSVILSRQVAGVDPLIAVVIEAASNEGLLVLKHNRTNVKYIRAL